MRRQASSCSKTARPREPAGRPKGPRCVGVCATASGSPTGVGISATGSGSGSGSGAVAVVVVACPAKRLSMLCTNFPMRPLCGCVGCAGGGSRPMGSACSGVGCGVGCTTPPLALRGVGCTTPPLALQSSRCRIFRCLRATVVTTSDISAFCVGVAVVTISDVSVLTVVTTSDIPAFGVPLLRRNLRILLASRSMPFRRLSAIIFVLACCCSSLRSKGNALEGSFSLQLKRSSSEPSSIRAHILLRPTNC